MFRVHPKKEKLARLHLSSGSYARGWGIFSWGIFACLLTGFDTSILPICKDSLGWMFNKLDMNYDLLLDPSEISAIYLDKYEPCVKPLFNSCDSFKDGKLSNNEWCYCFQKPGGECAICNTNRGSLALPGCQGLPAEIGHWQAGVLKKPFSPAPVWRALWNRV